MVSISTKFWLDYFLQRKVYEDYYGQKTKING